MSRRNTFGHSETGFFSEGLNLGGHVYEVFTLFDTFVVYRQGYHLCLGKALQEELMKGATDNSMPVGSGRVFMYFSSNYRTHVLPHSGLPPTTLFRNGLLITAVMAT
jgi:hypothetical protein